jgi:hypothetical protein
VALKKRDVLQGVTIGLVKLAWNSRCSRCDDDELLNHADCLDVGWIELELCGVLRASYRFVLAKSDTGGEKDQISRLLTPKVVM